MNWLKSFLEEKPGVGSSTRIAFLLMVLGALAIAAYQVITTATHTFDISNFATMTGTASGLKLFQKSQEVRGTAALTMTKD